MEFKFLADFSDSADLYLKTIAKPKALSYISYFKVGFGTLNLSQPELSGAHFFARGKALVKNSGNGARK